MRYGRDALGLLVAVGLAVGLVVTSKPAVAQDDTEDAAKSSIVTAVGRFEIGDVETGDRFPPGCEGEESFDCRTALEGYQVLVVWLEPGEGEDHAGLAAKLGEANIFEVSEGVRIVAADGTETESSAFGMMNDQFFVSFTPEETSESFTLHWPGNEAIQLDE